MATKRPARVNVEIEDEALLRAVRHVAVDSDLSLKDVVNQALRLWLEEREDAEDAAAIKEAKEKGGPRTDWQEVKAGLKQLELEERAAN